MNCNQKLRLSQIDGSILIVGVDIAKNFHVVRAQDSRGIEYCKGIKFDNDKEGFKKFEGWKNKVMKIAKKDKVIIGMEPTGPYWFTLARWLKQNKYWIVTVNPAHVKKSKELDDNNQSKTDNRDARVIAQLVKEGRFSEPNLLQGTYEELRNAKNLRRLILKNSMRTKNQIDNWFVRYFPEYSKAYTSWESKSFICVMKKYKLPGVIAKLSPQKLYCEVKKVVPRGVGINKITDLIKVCSNSIGMTSGLHMAGKELEYLLKQYEESVFDIENIETTIEDLCEELPEVKILMQIKGISTTTASGIVAEYGSIQNYKTSKQMIKMAGLSLTENSSGIKKGKMSISKRGRKDLRKILFLAMLGMIKNNPEFHDLYLYYRHRAKNQLNGKQAMVVLMIKLIRIIHTIVTRNIDYNKELMVNTIIRPKEFIMHKYPVGVSPSVVQNV